MQLASGNDQEPNPCCSMALEQGGNASADLGSLLRELPPEVSGTKHR